MEDNETSGLGRRDRGATAVEYGLILALIAAVVILAVTQLGDRTQELFEDTEQEMVDNGM